MWWRRRRFDREDLSLRALAALLLEGTADSRRHLYLEMTIVECEALILEETGGTFAKIRPDDMLRTQARELWTQFRLNDRPIWRALELSCSTRGEFSTAFVYEPSFDDNADFAVRSRRWAVRTGGIDAFAALRAHPDDSLPSC
jgi:hypothetical protein